MVKMMILVFLHICVMDLLIHPLSFFSAFSLFAKTVLKLLVPESLEEEILYWTLLDK